MRNASNRSMKEATRELKKELQELKKTKIENEQLKRKLDEQRQSIELEFEQKLTERLKDEASKISKRETDKNELKVKELHEVIDSMKNQMEEMKRRADQGSMQLQGEVQELALEEMLRSIFPFDLIEEVGKGVKGADVIHTVKNKQGNDCGKILYESKTHKSIQ